MTDSNSSPYNLPWEFEIFEGQGPFDIQLNNEQFSSEFVDDNGNGESEPAVRRYPSLISKQTESLSTPQKNQSVKLTQYPTCGISVSASSTAASSSLTPPQNTESPITKNSSSVVDPTTTTSVNSLPQSNLNSISNTSQSTSRNNTHTQSIPHLRPSLTSPALRTTATASHISVPLNPTPKSKLRSLSQGSYASEQNIPHTLTSTQSPFTQPLSSSTTQHNLSSSSSSHSVEKSEPLEDFPPHLEAELNRLLQDDETSPASINSTSSVVSHQHKLTPTPPPSVYNTIPHSVLSSTSTRTSSYSTPYRSVEQYWNSQPSTSTTSASGLSTIDTGSSGILSSSYNRPLPSVHSLTAPPSPSLSQQRVSFPRRGSGTFPHPLSTVWNQPQQHSSVAYSQSHMTTTLSQGQQPHTLYSTPSAGGRETTKYSTCSPPLRTRSASTPSSVASSPSLIRLSHTHMQSHSYTHLHHRQHQQQQQSQQQQQHLYQTGSTSQQVPRVKETETIIPSTNDTNTRLFFKALPVELDNYNFLLKTFMKFGEVKSLTCNSKRRFALVEFATREEAMVAKRECKKIQGPSGEVYRLKIFWGKDFIDTKQKKNKNASSTAYTETLSDLSEDGSGSSVSMTATTPPQHLNSPLPPPLQNSQGQSFILTSSYTITEPSTPQGHFLLDAFNIAPINFSPQSNVLYSNWYS